MTATGDGQAILVTGSSGFIGRALVARLVAAGERVVGFDRAAEGSQVPRFVQGDVQDLQRLQAVLAGEAIDRIVHLGALSGPMLARGDPHLMMRINVLGTANVLEAARVAGVARVVFLSSIMAYGARPGERPVTEEQALDAADAYGSSKVAGEAMMRAYAREHDLDTVSLRVGGVFGPGRRTDCLITLMVRDALAGRPTALAYGRGWRRQYLYVDDAVAAIRRVLARPRLPQAAYNVTGGTWLPLEEIAAFVARVLPAARVDLGEAPHPLDYPIGPLDITAAGRDFGYVPAVSLEEGIRRHVDWIRREG